MTHFHFLGIGGTLMASTAILLRRLGHKVTGVDSSVYPPMDGVLLQAGIDYSEIPVWQSEAIDPSVDVHIVGNVLSRGHASAERLLSENIKYASAPEVLREYILTDRKVIAVAGTHGKTTTSAMLAHIFDTEQGSEAGGDFGWLIAGDTQTPKASAQLGSKGFVIEADEYDTAFFDKQPKFLHYRPQSAIWTNIEYDHADIYPDLASIERQFHRMARQIPADGVLVTPWDSEVIERVVESGLWCQRRRFAVILDEIDTKEALKVDYWQRQAADTETYPDLLGQKQPHSNGFACYEYDEATQKYALAGSVEWSLFGIHNIENALAAVLMAKHNGVEVSKALTALNSFRSVRRRGDVIGSPQGIMIIDDYAHHPTAVRSVLSGLHTDGKRLLAVLELRSNSMKIGTHSKAIPNALALAEHSWVWDGQAKQCRQFKLGKQINATANTLDSVEKIISAVKSRAQSGDQVVVMSNGPFENFGQRLLKALS